MHACSSKVIPIDLHHVSYEQSLFIVEKLSSYGWPLSMRLKFTLLTMRLQSALVQIGPI